MTEQELRNKVVSKMLGWEGAVRGDARHAEILSIYNNHKPLARGYTVQNGDAYCATTASAAYIAAGIADWTGTECGVGQWVEIARQKGIWVENDAYAPKAGDAICYDWDDSGTGENLGYPDHVGIVISVSGSSFVVLEGNINGGKVGRRNMQVNGRYIRGFICPDFAAIAAEKSKTASSAPEKKTVEELALEVLSGKWGGGAERKEALEAAGYDYAAVQAAVNALSAASETAEVQSDDLQKPTNERDRLLALLGDKWVEGLADVPAEMRAEVRELIELGALRGVREAEQPEDTALRMPYSALRAMVVALRAAKALAAKTDKTALADALAAAAAALR